VETALAISTPLRPKPFSTAVLILALSIWGWSQQSAPAGQKGTAAATHPGTIEFRNTRYGFSFFLPESWKGYQVLWSEWEGDVLNDDGSVARTFRGPELKIRHPKWTQQNPWEDMPIMIFTIAQWNQHPNVSAAPFDPGEIGRNKKYVFAVPPRWNYDFSEGWEEAQKILNSESLRTFSPSTQ